MIVWDVGYTERRCSGGVLDVRQVRAHVRRMLAETLAARDHGFDAGDVDLMVCEITTNAVRHSASGSAGGGVWVTMLFASRRIRVEIQDDGGARAVPAIPSQGGGWAESGRGLLVVDGLADRWGTSVGNTGQTTVWFEVAG